jgi:molecular chaperone GrpE
MNGESMNPAVEKGRSHATASSADAPDDAGRIDAAPGDARGAEAGAAGPDALAALQAECAALNDKYLRLYAEFENFRKRSAREWREQQQRAGEEVLREMLELADNLERALAAPPEDAAVLRKGVELIAQQLQAKLKRFGVEPLEVRGAEFDPLRHEAVLMVDSADVASHHVVDEVQRGYLLNGEVFRPSRVTVAR